MHRHDIIGVQSHIYKYPALKMPKRLSIKTYLTVEELEIKYRSSKELIERSRYQIIWLLAKGMRTEEVSSVTSYKPDSIRKIARRYNDFGPSGLGDSRKLHEGAKPLLNEIQSAQLFQAISGPGPNGGLWNGRLVAEKMSELIGRPVSRQRGWEYLKSWNFRWRTPRPEHSDSDLNEQEEWKKNSIYQ